MGGAAGVLLVTDIPAALEQADKSFAFIAKSLGRPSPPLHFISDAWAHPWFVVLVFALLFAFGVGLSWCWDALLERLSRTTKVDQTPEPAKASASSGRDTSLSEALGYAAFGEWGKTYSEAMAAGLASSNGPLDRFRQLASEGALTTWGKRDGNSVFSKVSPSHWRDHRLNLFELMKGTARSESLSSEAVSPIVDIMVNKAEFERQWPPTDQPQSAPPTASGDQAAPVPSSKADILARRIREHPATAQFDYPTLKAILRLEILHPTGQRSAQAGSPPFKTEVTAKISSIHKATLADCSVVLISVERHGIAETINRPFSYGGEGTFRANPHMPHTFYLVSRSLGDPITPDPFVIKLVGQTVTLEECTDYKLRLELRAPPYPFPTIAEVTIRTGIGLELECIVTAQHLPEIG